MDIDEALVVLVQTESIIWKRNHLHFKNVHMKEQAWGRVSYQLGISGKQRNALIFFVGTIYKHFSVLSVCVCTRKCHGVRNNQLSLVVCLSTNWACVILSFMKKNEFSDRSPSSRREDVAVAHHRLRQVLRQSRRRRSRFDRDSLPRPTDGTRCRVPSSSEFEECGW